MDVGAGLAPALSNTQLPVYEGFMCWSGEASTVLATIGLSSTVYFYYKKEPAALCAALGYFSLMEVLQAYTYTVIDECSNPANQLATLLGYILSLIHI